MFARFTIIHTDTDKIDEAAKLFEESVVPAFQSQKGYQAIYFLSDRKTGKNICVSIWETEEDAVNNEESRLYQEQLVKFMDLFTEPPIREGYEVIVRAQLE
ncbi:antibiotic biosynthesis monooxygenase family protein [Acidobacteriota bacterium]